MTAGFQWPREFGYFREEVRKAGLPVQAPPEFVMREPTPWPRRP